MFAFLKYLLILSSCFFISLGLYAKGKSSLWEVKRYSNEDDVVFAKRSIKLNDLQIGQEIEQILPNNKIVNYVLQRKVLSDDAISLIFSGLDSKSNQYAVVTKGKKNTFVTIYHDSKSFQYTLTDTYQKLKSNLEVDDMSRNLISGDDFLNKNYVNTKKISFSKVNNERIYSDEIVKIKVLPILTNRMNSFYEGDGKTRVIHIVNLTNKIFENSNVKIELELSDFQYVDYETISASDALDRLGQYQFEFRGIREKIMIERVDFLSMFDIGSFNIGSFDRTVLGLSTSGFGISNKELAVNNGYLLGAFTSLTSANSPDWIFAHEIGHNLGLGHSRKDYEFGDDLSGPEPNGYSYGWGYGKEDEFITLMSGWDFFQITEPIEKLMVFSSPELDCMGRPCGISHDDDPLNSADAVSAMNDIRFYAQDILEEDVTPIRVNTLSDNILNKCEFHTPFGGDLDSENDYAIFLEETGSLFCEDVDLSELSEIPNNQFKYASSFSLDGKNKKYDISQIDSIFTSNLSNLTIKNSNISNLDELQSLKGLEILQIKNSELVDSELLNLEYKYLTHLSLSNTGIRDITFINKLNKVSSIRLYSNDIRDISSLLTYSKLESLVLSNNPIIQSENELQQIINNNNNLKYIGFSNLNILPNDPVLTDLSNIELQNLDLSYNYLTEPPNLEELVIDNNSLRSLYLSGNKMSDLHEFTWLGQLPSLLLNNNNIFDITPLLNYSGNDLWLQDNPIFCWQIDMLKQHFELYPDKRLLIGDDCTVDSDHDLLPDSWEIDHGLDSNDPNDAILDRDNDGESNLEEFKRNNIPTDFDNDGTINDMDAFPLDAAESVDTDNDGVGNNADTDDDGDGVEDSADAFPLDASESLDTDSDGIGNNADTDDDGDGVVDSADAYPLDSSRSSNSSTIDNSTSSDSSGGGGSMHILLFLLFSIALVKFRSRNTFKINRTLSLFTWGLHKSTPKS